MKNLTEPTDLELQDIEQMLNSSSLATRPSETKALQKRILNLTEAMQQNHRSEKPLLHNLFTRLTSWVAPPRAVGAVAVAIVLLATVLIWLPQSGSVDSSKMPVATDYSAPRLLDQTILFSVLSEGEVEMDEYENLVWEEVLLTEDELAFAMF